MGYRIHFYILSSEDLKAIGANQKNFYDFKDLLCMEMNPTICNIWTHCKPCFIEGTPEYKRTEEDNPCMVFKAELKEMVLAFYKDYQKYIIRELIDIGFNDIPGDNDELFRRCLHFQTKPNELTEQELADDRHSKFSGQYQLHQQFLIHCTSDGFNVLDKNSSNKHFEKLLEEPFRMNDGNTMYDILVQLIYLYKIYNYLDSSKFLVIAGW